MAEQLTGMMTEDEFFEHAGVKGMKWGKRKAKGPASADAARVNKIKNRVKKNGVDNLSNDEIAKLNKRNQLVSQYKKDNPNVVKKGYKATKDVVAAVGTLTAAAVIVKKAAVVIAGAAAAATLLGTTES